MDSSDEIECTSYRACTHCDLADTKGSTNYYYCLNLHGISIITAIIGFTLFFGFYGPYMELQDFKTNYREATCVAGSNYKVRGNNEKLIYGTTQYIIYSGVNVYVYDEKKNTTVMLSNIKIRRPSTSYKIVYEVDNMILSMPKISYFHTNKTCLIHKNLTGSAIIEINYEHKIMACFIVGAIFTGVTCLLLACYWLPHLLYCLYYYPYGYWAEMNEYKFEMEHANGYKINIDNNIPETIINIQQYNIPLAIYIPQLDDISNV